MNFVIRATTRNSFVPLIIFKFNGNDNNTSYFFQGNEHERNIQLESGIYNYRFHTDISVTDIKAKTYKLKHTNIRERRTHFLKQSYKLIKPINKNSYKLINRKLL